MKLDFDRAWKDTVQMLAANRGLLAVIAGTFVFLPWALAIIALPGMDRLANPQPSADFMAFRGAVLDFAREYWWAIAAILLLLCVGSSAMLALLKRKARPTVGEALVVGAKSVLPSVAVFLVVWIGTSFMSGLIVGIGATTGLAALVVVAAALSLALTVYIFVRLSLVGPVMAIEDKLNPVAAVRRSWRLTNGNGLRLFIFYLLIFIASFVVSIVASMLISLFFALLGEQVALFGTALGSALINAVFIVLFVGVLAAVHAQLSRLDARAADADAPVI